MDARQGPGGPVVVVRDPEAHGCHEPSAAERAARALAPAFDGVAVVETGRTTAPEAVILREARRIGAGLIAMPAGRFLWGGVPRALEGPERAVARQADRPVLLVPDSARWSSPPVFGAATDFSEPATFAVRWTAALAGATGAGLRLVHVLEAPDLDPSSWLGADALTEAARRRARRRIARLARELRADHGIRVDPGSPGRGTPCRMLCESAAGGDVDVLGIGALGVGSARGRLMGRTAEGILGRHPGAVVVVRREGDPSRRGPRREPRNGAARRDPRPGRCPAAPTRVR